ncbi:MAG: hypothetical protein ACAI35_09200 [Candidatus Methylacidiphilales bacterium]|nr:hypothetical protein [Candidatus Methylacidiphilales bacterium]
MAALSSPTPSLANRLAAGLTRIGQLTQAIVHLGGRLKVRHPGLLRVFRQILNALLFQQQRRAILHHQLTVAPALTLLGRRNALLLWPTPMRPSQSPRAPGMLFGARDLPPSLLGNYHQKSHPYARWPHRTWLA